MSTALTAQTMTGAPVPLRTQQARRAALLRALVLLYAALFIPANLHGARDPAMLSIFQIDEYAQWPVVAHMLAALLGPHPSLHAFLHYGYYTYGFPFFLLSTLALVPVALVCALLHQPLSVPASLLVLRELSPLCLGASIALLVDLWTRGRAWWWATLLFGALGAIPAAVAMDLQWHPDGLATLCVVAALWALVRDRGRCGRSFWAAAVCCGLAAGTKVIGVYLAPAVLVSLVLAWRGGLPGRATLARGVLFAAIASGSVLGSNPLLLESGARAQILATLRWQATVNATNWGAHTHAGLRPWYDGALHGGFGSWWLLALALGVCAIGAWRDRPRRATYLLLLAWALPLSAFLVFTVASTAERYFIPVLLPLLSCLGSPWPWQVVRRWRPVRPRLAARRGLFWVAVLPLALGLLAWQGLAYARADGARYQEALGREAHSPALAFYARLAPLLARHGAPTRVILRDPYIYLPPGPHADVQMRWGALDYGDVATVRPDLLLLQRDRMAGGATALYRAAERGQVRGYRTLLAASFAVAFVRTGATER